MTLSRRHFLQLTGAGLVSAPLGCTDSPSRQAAAPEGVLDAYLDTLLPEDGTPGALALEVPARVRALLRSKRALQPVYAAGTRWLEAHARQAHGCSFATCSLAERHALVRLLSEQDDDLLKRFFHKSLRHARMFFYSDPRAWSALGITGAPQPVGFMDYARPPGKHG